MQGLASISLEVSHWEKSDEQNSKSLAGMALIAACSSFVGMGAATAKCVLVGKIIGVDGPTLLVKTAQDEVKVNVPHNVMVIASSNGTLARY